MPVENNATVNISLQRAEQLAESGAAQFATNADREQFQQILTTAREQAKAVENQSWFNPILEIPKPTNAAELGLLTSKWNDSNTVTISEVLTLLHEFSVKMKAASKEHRNAAREAEMKTALDAAEKIMKAAKHALNSGLISGATQIASGGIGILGAGAGGLKMKFGASNKASTQMNMRQTQMDKVKADVANKQMSVKSNQAALKAAKAKIADNPPNATSNDRAQVQQIKNQVQESKAKLSKAQVKEDRVVKDFTDAKKDFDIKLQKDMNSAQRWTQSGQAFGQLVTGGGQIFSAYEDAESKKDESERAELEALQAVHRNMAQDASERVQDNGSHEQATREKMSSIEEANQRLFSTTAQI